MNFVLPDEASAENAIMRYRDTWGEIARAKRDVLSLLASHSNFIGRAIIRDPGILDHILSGEYIDAPKPEDVTLGETCGICEVSSSVEHFLFSLRRYKYRELSRIVYRSIVADPPFEEIMAELADLASSVLEASYRFFSREFELGSSGRFVILGMGKLGGRELNLSSDIDLVYYYRGIKDPSPFFKLAERITKSLSAVTEDGFLYRVDLGLRPGGSKSPIALSVDGALEHYFYWGDTWERAALIKTRAVAGDRALGEEFCREVEPFVYKRYLDFSSVEDLKDMKTKLDRLHKKRDVKLGKGGIREIEFFVQALQLVNGGAVSSLRVQNTLSALERLYSHGIIEREVYASLSSAYLFLRRLEHNIQLVDELQTHRLPQDPESLARISKMMGYGSRDDLEHALSLHTSMVSRIYDRLFYEPSKIIEEESKEFWELADFLTEGHIDEEQAIQTLSRLGFKNPETAIELIDVLLDPKRGGLTHKARSAAKKVIPAFLSKVIRSSNPDALLGNLVRFVTGIGWRTSIYSILAENPDIMELLAKLFSASGYLSNFLITHPEYLDVITLKSLRREHSSKEEMIAELEESLGAEPDYEKKLNAIRRFKHVETIKLCLRDLNKEVDPFYVGEHLTRLADAILEVGLRVAGEGMGMPEEERARMLLLGLGKLGGREMGYNSDLDLVFIYEKGDHARFSKLGQRLISVLSLNTFEGYAYKIDTRLRPSGRSGALVSSFESYKNYHERGAMLWERQALIKARPAAGNMELGREVMKTIEHFVYEEPLAEGFHREINHMRARMEKELARETAKKFNLKTGRGGLVDIEFVVQMLQLKHGREHHAVRVQNTLLALERLQEQGLLDRESYVILKDALYFLKTIENMLRLLHDRATNELYEDDFQNLSREMGIDDGRALREIYEEKTAHVRAVYEKYFS
jgi:glutamate-ammonia-ligase adenylyltransferase